MSILTVAVRRERREGFDPGPRVRPRRDRLRLEGAAGLAAVGDAGGGGPRVLVTMDRDAEGPWVSADYVDAVHRAGGSAWLVPPDADDLPALLAAADAVLVTGGAFDIHPRHYGAAVAARLDRTDEDRTGLELALCAAALASDLPLLGVCGGMQALAVAGGGSLIQDLPAEPSHEQPTDPGEPWHPVRLSGVLATWFGPEVPANSTHHQAVATLGGGAVVEGRSPDGVVEAMRVPGRRFVVGVQWHPERMGQQGWYDRLVRAAAR